MRTVSKSPFGLTPLQIWLAAVWTAFVVGLASWWGIFSLRLVDKLAEGHPLTAGEISRHRWMLLSEGSILVFALLCGGIALLIYMIRERKAQLSVRRFFATYTHDLKTALASLRLQTESLYEDFAEQPQSKLLNRLLQDVARLEVQLENSLLLAAPEHQLWFTAVDLPRVIQNLKYQLGDRRLLTQLPERLAIRGDERAIEVIFRNLLHNSFVHGHATEIRVACKEHSKGKLIIEVSDNGRGFKGNRTELAKPFLRHQPNSGSGVGLYVVMNLMERMGGVAEFPEVTSGFVVELVFQEEVP